MQKFLRGEDVEARFNQQSWSDEREKGDETLRFKQHTEKVRNAQKQKGCIKPPKRTDKVTP